MSLKTDALILLEAVPDLHETGAAKWVLEAAHILRQVAYARDEAVQRAEMVPLTALNEEWNALQRDAERYRWLVNNIVLLPYPDQWEGKDWLDGEIDRRSRSAQR